MLHTRPNTVITIDRDFTADGVTHNAQRHPLWTALLIIFLFGPALGTTALAQVGGAYVSERRRR